MNQRIKKLIILNTKFDWNQRIGGKERTENTMEEG